MPSVPQNKKPVWANERKAFDRMKNDNQSFYNSTAWRTLAKAHKAAFPLCANHRQCKGVAYITDHIKPINEGGGKYDWDNLQSLCKRCNAVKTGKQARKRGNVDPTPAFE
jgi:5-methylcytosine-specific restriction endonuclease McrA